MNVDKILLALASICAVWLAILMRRKGDRLGAVEHTLLAFGLADFAWFTNFARSWGAFLLFAAMVGALVDWYLGKYSRPRDQELRGESR
jgi:hypothetical protein